MLLGQIIGDEDEAQLRRAQRKQQKHLEKQKRKDRERNLQQRRNRGEIIRYGRDDR